MSSNFILHPIRLRNNILARTDDVGALMQLIRIAAQTPSGSWAGSSNFGFRDYLEANHRCSELPRTIIDKLNESLMELNAGPYVVQKIRVEEGSALANVFEVDVLDLRSTETSSLSLSLSR